MKKTTLFKLGLLISTVALATPIVPMNRAFRSLLELVPSMADPQRFMEKKSERRILKSMEEMDKAFKSAKHDSLMKQDIFAPSLEVIRSELKDSITAFKNGKKDFALWRMRSISSQCLNCHTRLPDTHASSFQDGLQLIDASKFKDPYDQGIAQLIVRRYPDAKTSFTRAIDEAFIKKQFVGILLPLKQLLLIQTKVMKDPAQMRTILEHYVDKQGLSKDDRDAIKVWMERLSAWSRSPLNDYKRLSTDREVKDFIKAVMNPLFKNNNLYVGKHDVDLLMASGLLSNFIFENPQSDVAPEVLYWVGMSEKFLERESFFGNGELFLRDCVQRYPKSKVAKDCFNEYKESVEFKFSGSRGTDIPPEIQRELDLLELLITP